MVLAREQAARPARPLDADALYRTHACSVYAFIHSKVGTREVAEDLTSEVFVKALTHLDPTRAEHSIVAWLFRVAHNAIADYWRAHYRSQVTSLEVVRQARRESLRGAASAERARVAAHAVLEQLPDHYRLVLTHRILEGLSVGETAQRLGLSVANVKVLQHRALKRAARIRADAVPIDRGAEPE